MKKKLSHKKKIIYFLLCLLLVAGYIAIKNIYFDGFVVSGSGMSPTVDDGKYLMVNRIFSPEDIDRGDVIAFRYPNDPSKIFIKRIVGLPNETISITSGETMISGKPIAEPYAIGNEMFDLDEKALGSNEYFVLGDNRGNSDDSRFWGPLPVDFIVGKVRGKHHHDFAFEK